MKIRNVSLSVEEWAKLISAQGKEKINIPVWLRVSGNSMSPTIRRNRDRVLLTPVQPEELQVGDIVLFPWNGKTADYCLHRICTIEGERVRTQGDANRHPDGWTEKREILGKVIKIKRGSWIVFVVNSIRQKLDRF